MLFSSWLRNGKRNVSATTRSTQTSSHQRARFRPQLGALEARRLPSGAGLPYPTAASVSQLVADIKYADSAAGAITINLAPKTTFTLKALDNSTNGANGLPVIGGTKALTLTIIGNGDTITRGGSKAFRFLDVAKGASLTLDHVTLQGGSVSSSGGTTDNHSGGAVYNQGTLNVINGSTLSGNSATYGYGGGIDNVGGTVTVSNGSTLYDNTANSGGGGIYNAGGTVTVNSSTLTGNAANYGGGIDNVGGTVTVSNKSTLSLNDASNGGGIYNAGGTVTVSDSNLTGNDATFGGGIDNAYGGTVTVSISTLSGNYAAPDYSGRGGEGGGIYNSGGMVTISSSILSGNLSQGAGIFNDLGGTVTVKNSSSITGNMASDGDEDYYEDVYNLGVLYLDSTSTIYYVEGNSGIPI
jgi:hypothetical protein